MQQLLISPHSHTWPILSEAQHDERAVIIVYPAKVHLRLASNVDLTSEKFMIKSAFFPLCMK